MHEIEEALRLKDAGLVQREVAASLNSTVGRYQELCSKCTRDE